MQSDFIAEQLEWLDELITRPSNQNLASTDVQSAILDALKKRWKKENRLALLNDLSERYGEEEIFTILDRIIETNLFQDWHITGIEKGNSFERFLELLWVPLKDEGFEYTYEIHGNRTEFCVTKCPIHDHAREAGAEKWLYHLTCLTDGPLISGFNEDIQFSRTKTLMQGYDCCDHCYTDNSGCYPRQ